MTYGACPPPPPSHLLCVFVCQLVVNMTTHGKTGAKVIVRVISSTKGHHSEKHYNTGAGYII